MSVVNFLLLLFLGSIVFYFGIVVFLVVYSKKPLSVSRVLRETFENYLRRILIAPLKMCLRVSLVINLGLQLGTVMFFLLPTSPALTGIVFLFSTAKTATGTTTLGAMVGVQFSLFVVAYTAHILIWAFTQVFAACIDVIRVGSKKLSLSKSTK